jgi:hypothetical protein
VVAIEFRPGEQFPRFTLYPPHFVKQGFAEALLVLGLGSANCISDVVFMPQQSCRGNRNAFRYVSQRLARNEGLFN